MKAKRIHRKIAWTKEDKARHRAIREQFRHWHPSLEELLATGDYEAPVPLGMYLELTRAMHQLKQAREKAGMNLAVLSHRTGMDKAFLSRLENGHQGNPTLETLYRYALALGKEIQLVCKDLPKTRKPRTNALAKPSR